jgi:proteic killer suppression protein
MFLPASEGQWRVFTFYPRIVIYDATRYNKGMIHSFRDDTTEDIFQGRNTKSARKIPSQLHRRARLMLDQLNAVIDANAMGTPPGTRLHKLSGDLNDFWSVSVNDQYRIIFRFENGHAYDVQITDYH